MTGRFPRQLSLHAQTPGRISGAYPGVELTGRFERREKPVDLGSVMLEIDDAIVVDIQLRTRAAGEMAA
jgi:hypothetical protein